MATSTLVPQIDPETGERVKPTSGVQIDPATGERIKAPAPKQPGFLNLHQR